MMIPLDIHLVPNRKPDLSKLPPEIASRVEDMWRVGSILSKYFYLKTERDQLRTALGEMASALVQHASVQPTNLSAAMDDSFRIQQKYSFSSIFDRFRGKRSEAPLDVDMWVSTTHAECNRLASEAKLLFFQMALDRLPEKNTVFAARPLLDCLRRVRNASVHHKPLSLSSAEFAGRLVDASDPSGPGINITETEAWYLEVKRADLDESRPGPIAPEIAKWFIRQSDRWPLEKLLILAVAELCEIFSTMPAARC